MNVSVKGIFIVVVVTFLASCCNKNNIKPDYPQYSYTSNIVNPPDYFQVNYNVSFAGNKQATITFDTNSVWAIKKLGDTRVLFSVNNGIDNLTIVSLDTLGLTGGKAYKFTANNNSSLDLTTYIVEFTKVNTNYSTFEPKF
ncbi:MAG: hypothetical protein C0595_06115 [Marinilabiliales bacterium]|nr:MAG: hypothetical protein C0595_06115 [Marinilabiliales bacterium]